MVLQTYNFYSGEVYCKYILLDMNKTVMKVKLSSNGLYCKDISNNHHLNYTITTATKKEHCKQVLFY